MNCNSNLSSHFGLYEGCVRAIACSALTRLGCVARPMLSTHSSSNHHCCGSSLTQPVQTRPLLTSGPTVPVVTCTTHLHSLFSLFRLIAMHKMRGGGGGGGRRGPAARPIDAAPAVWQSFITTNLALCQLIVDELTEKIEAKQTALAERGEEGEEEEEEEDEEPDVYEETVEMLTEQIEQFEQIKKRKLPFNDRMGLIGMLCQLSEDQLPLLAAISDADKVVEMQVEDIVGASMGAALAYMKDCLQRAGGNEKSKNKLQQDSEQEALMTMKLIDVQLTALANGGDEGEGEEETTGGGHAKRIVASHVKDIFNTLITVGLNRHRADEMRQAAFSVISNTIEADGAMFSPRAEAAAATEEEGGLSEDDKTALITKLVDAVYALCGEEGEMTVEASDFTAEQLGTTLLDTLVTAITPTAHTAQLVYDRSRSLLTAKQTPANQQAAALLTLAVLPSTAPTWCKERLDELTALVQPALNSTTTSVKAAAFVMIGELLEHVPAAYERHAEEWTDKILAALKDEKEPLPLKLKVCLPLIQLAAHEPAEHEEAEESKEAAEKRTALVARIVPDVLTLLTAQSGIVAEQSATADKSEVKRRWQFITLLAATLEGAVQSSSITLSASLPRIVSTLLPFWVDSKAEDADAWPARAKITAVIAAVASDEANRAVVEPHMQQLLNGLKVNAAVKDYVVRAATFEAWVAVLPVAREEVKAEVDDIVKSVARVMDMEYTLSDKKPSRRGGRGGRGGEEDEEEDEDEEGEDDMDDMEDEQADEEMQDIDNERTAAFNLLQHLITQLGNEFLPHFSPAWEVILDNATEYSGDVQEQLIDTITLLPALFSPPQPASATATDSCCTPAPAATTKYQPGQTVQPPAEAVPVLQSARKLLFQLMLFSHESYVVAHCFEALSALLQTYGQWLLLEDGKAMAALVKNIKKVLKGEAICQQGFSEALPAFLRDQVGERGDEGEEEVEGEDGAEEAVVEDEEDEGEEADGEADGEDEEDDENDANNLLLEKSIDCLSTVAKVRGAAFDTLFSSLYPYILRAAPQSTNGYVYGCFADLTAPLAVAARPSWVDTIVPRLLSVIDKQLARKSHKGRFAALRNVSYASGTIIFNGQEALKDYRQQAAGKYAAVITAASERAKTLTAATKSDSTTEELSDVYGCRDNAASALGKVLLVGAEQVKDQLATLIPTFLSAMPLREDGAEQSTVYSALVKLATTYTDTLKAEVAPHLPAIAQALKTVVVQPVAEDGAGVCTARGELCVPRKVADFVTKAAATFYTSHAADKSAWESGWSAEEKEQFNKRLSSVAA